ELCQVEVVGLPAAAMVDDDVVAGAAGFVITPGLSGGGGQDRRAGGGVEVQRLPDLAAVVVVRPALPAREGRLEVGRRQRRERTREQERAQQREHGLGHGFDSPSSVWKSSAVTAAPHRGRRRRGYCTHTPCSGVQ